MSRKFLFLILWIILVVRTYGEFNLTVVHISDFHSHWFEFDENKHDCSKDESREGKCYGGFARLLTLVRDIRKREKNVIVLSSGEFFLGRSLHAMHGWKPAHALLPRLGLDAMSLSNHDFDSRIFELSAFLYSMKFPVLCANMWARNTSFLYSRVNKSAVIDVNGTKVGIVGYIHRHALKKSKSATSVKFSPEIPALKEEVSRLEGEGVNKIIALGHAGYHTDLEIARHVKGVDIVIGGDSDIMLFDPGHDASEAMKIGNIHGNYPRVHEHEPESDAELMNRTLVLHIPQHGMYVGVLRATFDDNGKIIHESGEPVLLDSSIPQDEETLEFLTFAKGALETIAQHRRLPDDAEILGQTSGHLDGNRRRCRMQECSFGNFIADAMLHEFIFNHRNGSEHVSEHEQWGPIDALVFNSGPIQRSIEPGYIKIQDILKSVTLGAFIRRVYMTGQELLNMMEHSVKHYDPSGVTAPGAFLQISGLRVVYDLSKLPGRRVRSLSIRCSDCEDDTTYRPIRTYKTYIIGMPNFLRTGRDGYSYFDSFEDEEGYEDMGQFDAELIVEYLRKKFYIKPKIDGRIQFYRSSEHYNTVLGNAPLLFGEPATETNTVEDLVTTPIDEEEIPETSTSSTKTKVETNYRTATFPNQETHKNERIPDVVLNSSIRKNVDAFEPTEAKLTESNLKTDTFKNDFTVASLYNVHTTESNSRPTAQSVQKNKTESVGKSLNNSEASKSYENSLTAESNSRQTVQSVHNYKAEPDEESSDNSEASKLYEHSLTTSPTLPEDEMQVNHTSTIEDILKVLLMSKADNFSSILETLANDTPNASIISGLLDKVSLAISSRIKRRSVEDLLENNENWKSSSESKRYISLIGIAVRNLLANNSSFLNFNVVEPLFSNSLQTKMLDGGSEVEEKSNSLQMEQFPVKNDIGLIFMSILKNTIGEDFTKILSPSNVNFTTSEETNH